MTPLLVSDRADVLVLDDQPDSLRELLGVLVPEFNVHPFSRGQALQDYVNSGRPVDLIMLDAAMAAPDGHALCRTLRAQARLEDVPVIFMSTLAGPHDEALGLAMGAADHVAKPYAPAVVLARVRNHVRLSRAVRLVLSHNDLLERRVAERTAELAARNAELQAALRRVASTQDVAIVALSSLAELRDNETGQHVQRTQNYLCVLARAVRERCPHLAPELDDDVIDLLYKSAPLHDIGKIAIPDRVLLKPGRLDAAEFEIMKTHTRLGRDAIELAGTSIEAGSAFLRYALEIAYGHHERWDGSGYPQGLAGSAIPLAARLMALADVYDALVSRRVYKSGLPHAEAVALITAERGRHFDPDLVDAFVAVQHRFMEIAEHFCNAPASSAPPLPPGVASCRTSPLAQPAAPLP